MAGLKKKKCLTRLVGLVSKSGDEYPLLFTETWQVSKQIENKQNILPGAGLAGLVSGVIKSEFEMRIRGFLLRGVDNMSGSRSLKISKFNDYAYFWRNIVLLLY